MTSELTHQGIVDYLGENAECPHGVSAFDVLCCSDCAPVLQAQQATYPFGDAGITREHYRAIGLELEWKPPEAVRPDLLLSVAHTPRAEPVNVEIQTDEFTAVCPWTGLPDTGRVVIRYVPIAGVLELKALKFYLLSFRDVGIIQEDAANRIADDLAECCQPQWLEVVLDYAIRGGLQTVVTATRGTLEPRLLIDGQLPHEEYYE